MRIAFLADSKGEDATERRRLGLLWRALFRIETVRPAFIDIHSLHAGQQEPNVGSDERVRGAWDLVLNATKDPAAADAFFPDIPISWAPPCDASSIAPSPPGNLTAIWLWEDGPLSDPDLVADQILPDLYEPALDHSIACYPDQAILADPVAVEGSSRNIVDWLNADGPRETGVPAELVESIVEYQSFDQLEITPYENIDALARASLLISDFSPPYRELAVAAVSNGAEVRPIGFDKGFVLGGLGLREPHETGTQLLATPIEWQAGNRRRIEDLVHSVNAGLQSISDGSIDMSSDFDSGTEVDCELQSHSFNPHTRLLIAVLTCRYPMVNALQIEGFAVSGDGEDLPDMRCDPMSPGVKDDVLQLRIVARLPLDVSIRDVAIRIVVENAISYDAPLPHDIVVQNAGFISVEKAGEDELIVEHWGTSPKSKIHSKQGQVVETVFAENGTGLHLVRSTIRQTSQDDKLTVIPDEGVGQLFSSISSYLAPQEVTSEALLQLKDAYHGQSAWLIGNGPSVRSSDLDRLQGKLCFAFNRFFLAYSNTKLRPQFTLCSDRQTIEDFFEEIAANAGGMVLRAQPDQPNSLNAAEWLRVTPVFPPLFSRNPAIRVSAGGSSPFIAMQVAHYLGIRRLYLYGMDFTYKIRKNPESRDPMRGAVGEGNHFIDDYRAGLPWSPPNTMNILMAFLTARELFAADGGSIRNASRGGALEIFERCDFERALEED